MLRCCRKSPGKCWLRNAPPPLPLGSAPVPAQVDGDRGAGLGDPQDLTLSWLDQRALALCLNCTIIASFGFKVVCTRNFPTKQKLP